MYRGSDLNGGNGTCSRFFVFLDRENFFFPQAKKKRRCLEVRCIQNDAFLDKLAGCVPEDVRLGKKPVLTAVRSEI